MGNPTPGKGVGGDILGVELAIRSLQQICCCSLSYRK
jgi:hypothetical protein